MTFDALAARSDALLNRDHSRRRAQVTAATQVKGYEQRIAAMEKELDKLAQQAERAARTVSDGEAAVTAAQAKAKSENANAAKVQTSVVTMEKLVERLAQRRHEIIKERSGILANDEKLRNSLSDRLQTSLATYDAERAERTWLATPVPEGEGGSSSSSALPAVDPYEEHARFRAALIAMADDFEDNEAAAKLYLAEYAAQAAMLETELTHVHVEVAEEEAASLALEERLSSMVAMLSTIQEEIAQYSSKFQSFNETSKSTSDAFAIQAKELTTATQRMRAIDATVRQLKGSETPCSSSPCSEPCGAGPASTYIHTLPSKLSMVPGVPTSLPLPSALFWCQAGSCVLCLLLLCPLLL